MSLSVLKSKKVRFFGKQISVTLLAMLALAGLASAGLLSYYGMVTATTTVNQSILVDGEDYTATITDEITESAPGGEIFCYKHKLTNQMSVPGSVNFVTTYDPSLTDSEITTTYYDLREKVTGGDNDVSCTEYTITQRGQMVFRGTNLTSDGNGGYVGRIPALCAFDVYAKEGSCAYVEGYYGTGDWNCEGPDTFTVGYYGSEVKDAYPSQQGGGPWGSWYDPDVADAPTVPYYLNLNSDGTWNIEAFGKTPYEGIINWDTNIALETGQDWSVQWTWGTEYIQLGHPAWELEITEESGTYTVVMTPVGVSTTSMTLQSGESAEFAICYEFAKAIEPGSYTITTEVQPA